MNSDDITGTVLVAIDGSHNSMLAAGVGARMARLLKSHLGLVHVVDMLPAQGFWGGVEAKMKSEIRDEAEQRLKEIAEKMQKECDVAVEFFLVEGLPEIEIQNVVENNPDILMLICGRQGMAIEKHSHLRLGRSFGHVSNKLSEILKVPLLIIPPDLPISHICPAMLNTQAQSTDESDI